MARCADGSGPSCLTLARTRGKDQTYWFLSACMAGIAEGCTGVGRAYARGEFGAPDELTAEKWYGIAAHVRP
jgi:TPR repeat protein